MTNATSAYVSREALERHMLGAAAGDPQILRHGTLGVFVLSSWEEWSETARAAGQIVPKHVRMQPYSDEEWDLDRFLDGKSPWPEGHAPEASRDV